MKLLGVYIPHAIIASLDEKGLICSFISEERAWDDHNLHFYERNTARRELHFSEALEAQQVFVRYSLEIHSMNPVANTKIKHLFPPSKTSRRGRQHSTQ